MTVRITYMLFFCFFVFLLFFFLVILDSRQLGGALRHHSSVEELGHFVSVSCQDNPDISSRVLWQSEQPTCYAMFFFLFLCQDNSGILCSVIFVSLQLGCFVAWHSTIRTMGCFVSCYSQSNSSCITCLFCVAFLLFLCHGISGISCRVIFESGQLGYFIACRSTVRTTGMFPVISLQCRGVNKLFFFLVR